MGWWLSLHATPTQPYRTPMTKDDTTRIHERLDELFEMVTKMSATCEICGPIMFGNGRPSIGTRVDRLERDETSRGRKLTATNMLLVGLCIALSSTFAGFTGGMVIAVFEHFLGG